ncbi:hypothetical protein GGS21DRAFT_521072 [Xylaria nigripes]|nr:hypothetical protein GGS21DRAFT_521072 [Xylaria nigripes]
MFRPPQRLCCMGSVRPVGLALPRKTNTNTLVPWPLHVQASFPSRNARPRYFTTSHTRRTTSSAATHVDSDQTPPPPRRTCGLKCIILLTILGNVAYSYFFARAPPAPVPIGSAEDISFRNKIQAQGATLPIVQKLSTDSSWTSWDAYGGMSTVSSSDDAQKKSAAQSRITSGALSGSSGLPFQRIFHNASSGEVVNVVYFGSGVGSWPNTVHGGALATVIDETMGRCAILKFPSRTGVTANLELRYRARTLTNNFYVIRVRPMDDSAAGGEGTKGRDRKLWVQGTVETETGQVNVEAKGLFVVPKAYNLHPITEGF